MYMTYHREVVSNQRCFIVSNTSISSGFHCYDRMSRNCYGHRGGQGEGTPLRSLLIHTPPNQGVQATASSVRSCLAPASSRA